MNLPLFSQSVSRFQYSDGSGNTYLLEKDLLKYSAVEPRHSSSGVYSGGESKEVKLRGSQVIKLKKVLIQSLRPCDSKSPRTMGSGLLEFSDPKSGKKITCILAMNSGVQKGVESALKAALGGR